MANLKKIILPPLSMLLLSGCAYGTLSKEAPPRALLTSPQAPLCIFMCFVHNTQGFAREDINSSGGGDVTTSLTENITDSSKDALGLGAVDASKEVPAPPQQ